MEIDAIQARERLKARSVTPRNRVAGLETAVELIPHVIAARHSFDVAEIKLAKRIAFIMRVADQARHIDAIPAVCFLQTDLKTVDVGRTKAENMNRFQEQAWDLRRQATTEGPGKPRDAISNRLKGNQRPSSAG